MIIKAIRSCLWACAGVIASLGMRLNNVDLVWLMSEASCWLLDGPLSREL